MRQRLGVARCLLADPELLILDEPMNGLDPAGILEFRDLIRELRRRGPHRVPLLAPARRGREDLRRGRDRRPGPLVAQGPIARARRAAASRRSSSRCDDAPPHGVRSARPPTSAASATTAPRSASCSPTAPTRPPSTAPLVAAGVGVSPPRAGTASRSRSASSTSPRDWRQRHETSLSRRDPEAAQAARPMVWAVAPHRRRQSWSRIGVMLALHVAERRRTTARPGGVDNLRARDVR